MGKGKIISNDLAGSYTIEIQRETSRLRGQKENLEEYRLQLITQLQAAQEAGDEELQALLQANIKSTEKQIDDLEELITNPVVSAKSIDYTTDLVADQIVGTVEVPGVRGTEVHIQPGYRADLTQPTPALYDTARDGQLQEALSGTPAGTAYNLAILPYWQRWKPTFRFATITDIDYDANTCTVCVEYAESYAQGIKINPGTPKCNSGSSDLAPAGFKVWVESNPDSPLSNDETADTTLQYTATLIDALQAINDAVNNSHAYLSDKTQYGTLENWAIMDAGQPGDCEDFALTKAKALLDAGYPAGALKLETGQVKLANGQVAGHAWLSVQTTNGNYGLDINYRTVSQTAVWRLYSARVIQVAGTIWQYQGTRLNDVPVEYMFCNASAFQLWDRVIVKFTGQSWDNPVVIGFRYGALPCNLNGLIFAGSWYSSFSIERLPRGTATTISDIASTTRAEKYNPQTDSSGTATSYPAGRRWLGSFGLRGKTYGCGGANADYPDYGVMSPRDSYDFYTTNSVPYSWDDVAKTANSMNSVVDDCRVYNAGAWSSISSLSGGLAEMASGSTDDRGYLFGGAYPITWKYTDTDPDDVVGYNVYQLADCREYDPALATWSAITDSPAYTGHSYNYGTAHFEQDVGEIWRIKYYYHYDGPDFAWDYIESKTVGGGERSQGVAFGIHDKIYLTGGGYGRHGDDSNEEYPALYPFWYYGDFPYYTSPFLAYPGWTTLDADEYDAETETWSGITAAPYSRACAGASGNFNAYSNAIVFAGVTHLGGAFGILQATADYRQALDAWSANVANLYYYSAWPAADGLGNYGWTAGGLSTAGGSIWVANNDHQLFDPGTTSWSVVGSLGYDYVFGNGGAGCI